MTRTRRLATALALAAVLALAALGVAQAVPAPATATSQHFFANTDTTDFFGNTTVELQAPLTAAERAAAVVKVTSGGSNLGGEDPSFATVNFAGFVDADTIRVRIIGWHANTITGQAEFRYYSNKRARVAVDVYETTT